MSRINTNTGKASAAHLGPGFVRAGGVADYLRVSGRSAGLLMAGKSVFPNQAGRFAWADIWWKLWRVRKVPAEFFEAMKRPLLLNADVAALLGVCERSIRRDGDRHEGKYDLPAHLDLSERIRRHNPTRIEFWSKGLPAPHWLEPVPAGSGLVLAGRKSPVSGVGMQVSDRPSDIGKYDKHYMG